MAKRNHTATPATISTAAGNQDSDCGVSRRLLAVMEYDGIPQHQRISHLIKRCDLHRATAQRLLRGFAAPRLGTLKKVANGLDVCISYLAFGEPSARSRTMRIYIQQIKGYSAEDAGRIMRVFAGAMMGDRRATNLMGRAAVGEISWCEAGSLYNNIRRGLRVPVQIGTRRQGSLIQFPRVTRPERPTPAQP